MLSTLIVSCSREFDGLSASKKPLPSNSLNEPRILLTIAWRTAKPIRLCTGSMAYVPVRCDFVSAMFASVDGRDPECATAGPVRAPLSCRGQHLVMPVRDHAGEIGDAAEERGVVAVELRGAAHERGALPLRVRLHSTVVSADDVRARDRGPRRGGDRRARDLAAQRHAPRDGRL